MIRSLYIAISLVVLLWVGSAAAQTTQDVASVQVGSEAPSKDYSQIGPISAKSGGGCGLFGKKGTFQDATNTLRRQASEMGADYVQILHQEGEHMAGGCLSRAYTIDGFAYKRSAPAMKNTYEATKPQGQQGTQAASGGVLLPRADMTVEVNSMSHTPASSPSPTMIKPDLYAELLKLDDLRKRGLLTDAEFDAAKRRLLDSQ